MNDGKERDVDPTDPDAIKANDVECTYCGAKPQQDCSRARSRGYAPEAVAPHRERVEVAIRAEAARLQKKLDDADRPAPWDEH